MELNRENLRTEVAAFRSSLGEEVVGNAEQALTLRKEGPVGIIEFDCPGEKINKFSTPNMLRLFELCEQIEGDDSIRSVVIFSKKPSIYIAGADISEIEKLIDGSVPVESLMKLQQVFSYLEMLPVPTLAAIHGACMGGGLEMAVSCDYRMVTDDKATKLGVPEVMLGVIPGWGGTQRLPKLVGLEAGLDLILTGRHIDGKKAVKIGLADRLVHTEWLRERALEWAEELAKTRKKRTETKQVGMRERILRTVPMGTKLIFDTAKKSVMKKTKGHYPAPLKALEVVQESFGGDLEEGLKVEAKAFGELVQTPECKNLIGLFYLNDTIKKDKGIDSDVRGAKIANAGVLGAGVMGGGIAQLFAARGVRARMKDINWDAITKGYQAAHKIFAKRVKRRRMKKFDLDNKMALIEGTTDYSGFNRLDIVVEAIVEDLEIKKKVFKELDEILPPKSVLASNTSSLSVTAMGEVCQHKDRVVGMHFFNPVDKMPLVEVIRTPESSDEAVATVVQFSKKLGKTPIVVKDAPGFVVNRILGPYLNESVYLINEGVDVEEMDKLMEKFGMPMGPGALIDEVGIDVAVKVSKVLYGAFGDRMKPPTGLEEAMKPDVLGKKTGKGIYNYEKGKRKGLNSSFFSGIKPPKRDSSLTDELIVQRMVYLMVNEAARILEEKVVRQTHDIDVGMIFGTGFAPFRGGLLRYADSVGVEKIASDLDMFEKQFGARFKPADFLQKLAIDKKGFYSN